MKVGESFTFTFFLFCHLTVDESESHFYFLCKPSPWIVHMSDWRDFLTEHLFETELCHLDGGSVVLPTVDGQT